MKYELTKEEKEMYKVIKSLRQDDYSIKDYLKAINELKRQEPKKIKKVAFPNH